MSNQAPKAIDPDLALDRQYVAGAEFGFGRGEDHDRANFDKALANRRNLILEASRIASAPSPKISEVVWHGDKGASERLGSDAPAMTASFDLTKAKNLLSAAAALEGLRKHYDRASPPVRSVEACDQPKVADTHVPQKITHNPVYGTFVAGSFPEKGFVYKLESSQSHPSLPESGDAKELQDFNMDKWSDLSRQQLVDLIEKIAKENEALKTAYLPPAGPAFEEWFNANLPGYAKEISKGFKWGDLQNACASSHKAVARAAWNAALACTPIDLNSTREEGEGWKADVRLGNPVYEVHILTPSGKLPIRQNTYNKEDLALASLRMAAPMDRFIRGHVQRVTKGTLTEVLSTICAKDDEIALKYARENKPVPDFVQGIGGKP